MNFIIEGVNTTCQWFSCLLYLQFLVFESSIQLLGLELMFLARNFENVLVSNFNTFMFCWFKTRIQKIRRVYLSSIYFHFHYSVIVTTQLGSVPLGLQDQFIPGGTARQPIPCLGGDNRIQEDQHCLAEQHGLRASLHPKALFPE